MAAPRPRSSGPDDENARRRRGRNWAMLLALLGISVLFYAIALVKLSRPTVGG